MKNKSTVKFLIVLLLATAAILWWRIDKQKREFNALVQKTSQVTEGYDQNFIAMVDRLEMELAERASFPYLGKKDPMTGKVRSVVMPQPREQNRASRRMVQPKATPATTPSEAAPSLPVVEAPDPVRLTAVIFDDIKRVHTAIMMVGERSYSVEVGDKVFGRHASVITVSSVTLEDQSKIYTYNINGQKSSRAK